MTPDSKTPTVEKKILVVDDDWALRELLKFKLKRHGFNVLTAGNEKEFWESAFEFQPDLIVLDLWLKNKIGTDIYNNLLQFGFDRSIPVIFVTALIDKPHLSYASERGRYALFSKPFDFEKLLEEIDRLLSTGASRFREEAKQKIAEDASAKKSHEEVNHEYHAQ